MDDTRGYIIENSGARMSIATTAGKYGGGALSTADGTADSVTVNIGSGLSEGNTLCISFLFRTASATKPSGFVYMAGVGSSVNDDTGGDLNNDLSIGVPTIGLISDGRVVIHRTGNNGGSYQGVVDINVCDGLWHHIEAAFKVDASTGISRLVVDGVESLQSITSGDTVGVVPMSDKRLDRVIFSSSSAQDVVYYFDDVIAYDDISSGIAGDLTYTSNFPLGEVRIETIQPNGVGTNSDWTPTSGDNYTNVDEDVADDDTTIVATGTATDLDTYAFSNLSGTPSSIYGVMIGSVGKASPGATTGIKHYTLSSAATDESAEITLIGAYQFNQTFVGQDPNTTAAWTEAGVNAAEFGIEKQ